MAHVGPDDPYFLAQENIDEHFAAGIEHNAAEYAECATGAAEFKADTVHE